MMKRAKSGKVYDGYVATKGAEHADKMKKMNRSGGIFFVVLGVLAFVAQLVINLVM